MRAFVKTVVIMGIAWLAAIGARAGAQQPPVPPPRASANAAGGVPDHHPSNFLVGFKPSIRAAAKRVGIHAAMNVKALHSCRHIPVDVVELPAGRTLEEMIAAYRALPQVAYAEPNYRLRLLNTPNDFYFNDLWGLHKIGATNAWNITTGSTNIIVAVIDTGIDYNHEDLADNMWVNPGPAFGDVYGATWTNGTGAMSHGDPMDDNSHGTHVAGTIGAVGNNEIGVVGVNWRVRLMALKFLDASGEGWTADAVSAIEYAIDRGARVSNNSWGYYNYSQSLKDAIDAAAAADHLFIAAVGNDSSNNDLVPDYPAGYDSPNIIAVASSDLNDNKSWFSNWGAASVHLAAPGSAILSAVPGGGYKTSDGTSMAAPHVTGVAALLLSVNPGMDYGSVKSWILDGVTPLAQWSDLVISGGRLNAAEALRLMKTTVARPEFEPDGGSHRVGMVEVTVTCATEGAIIRYTLDSTEPDESSQVVQDGNTVSVTLPGTLRAKAWKDGLNPSATKTAIYVLAPVVFGDYNGDGKTDAAVYHEATGEWYIRSLSGEVVAWGLQWGGPELIPVTGDYSGDGKSDLAVYHQATGMWYIRATDGSLIAWEEHWGGPGFVPVPGDFNGDGRDDLAVYHESTGAWYITGISDGVVVWEEHLGGPGFEPVTGDYSGDGKSDLAVYHQATGMWYIRAVDGSLIAWEEHLGGPGFVPVPGDFNGDGRSDLAVYHESTGAWYITGITGGVVVWEEHLGGPGFVPVPGDFNGDGKSDLAVYHQATGAWYIRAVDGSLIAWEEYWGGSGLVPAM